MSRNNIDSNKGRGLFNGFKDTVNDLVKLTEYIDDIFRQKNYENICGSWVARHAPFSMLIRKNEKGYNAIICDTSGTTKLIQRYVDLDIRRNKIFVLDCFGNPTGETMFYENSKDQLSLDGYGIFDAEEITLSEFRETDQDFVELELE